MSRTIVAYVILGLASAEEGRSREPAQSSLKAHVAVAQERHQRAVEQYHQERPIGDRAAARARYEEESRRDLGDLLDRVQKLPNDPAAVQTLQFVVMADHDGGIGLLNRAIELLARDHARRPGIGQYCPFLSPLYYSPAAESMIQAVLRKHPKRDDRAWACHALAEMLRIKVHMAQHFRKYPDQIPSYKEKHGAEAIERFLREIDLDTAKKEAEAVFERVVNEFGEVRSPRFPRTLGEIAAGELNAMRNLNVGQLAPDIQGTDVEGKRFKLSDFRGKVVLLVFSGEWYPECTEMYARQRVLLTRYSGRPFVVVDVNTDTAPDKLRASIKAGRVTWRCWWDGGVNGPIATSWAVKGYPYVYAIDKKGVIRFQNVREEGIDEAVDELMAKAKE